jgi:twinkle protein
MNWGKFGIDISKVVGGKTFCPKCHTSRKNKRDRSLSVDLKEGVFNCHNHPCEFRGTVREFKKREYVKPQPRLEKVGEKVLKFFESRMISNDTLLRMKITEAQEWMPQFEKEVPVICFNYYRNEDLVNIKFRGPEKSFKMSKDAELIFYNLAAIEEEVVIVEGEIDCLSMIEAGIYNCVSVPNGASGQRLEYLDNCWQAFEGCKRLILAVDNDEAGKGLKEELARRMGKERCYTVEYPEGCKDANDVLVKFGKESVRDLISKATQWPIEGIMTMDEIFPTITEWYEKGYPQGTKTGIPGFDEYLTFVPGQLTIVTGIPGHGKDEFSNWIMARLAVEGWPWGICGFEESPAETTTKLIEKITGKSFAFRKDPEHRVSVAMMEHAIGLIDRMFTFYNTDVVDTDVDGLLEKAEELVRRKGIKGFYLNPWNWIEHKKGQNSTETEYISECLSKIIRFAKIHQVHVILLAHTTKMIKDKLTKKYEVPNLYSISGSAHFFNKTHNGVTVYRDYETGRVDVYVQKVKQSWLGKIGYCSFTYDTFTRQYAPI